MPDGNMTVNTLAVPEKSEVTRKRKAIGPELRVLSEYLLSVVKIA